MDAEGRITLADIDALKAHLDSVDRCDHSCGVWESTVWWVNLCGPPDGCRFLWVGRGQCAGCRRTVFLFDCKALAEVPSCQ